MLVRLLLGVDVFDVLGVDERRLLDVDRLCHEAAVRQIEDTVGITLDIRVMRNLERRILINKLIIRVTGGHPLP